MLQFINAKINIGLDIVRRRPDGYHDLSTVFYPVGLYNGTPQCPYPFCDILEITPSQGRKPSFRFGGRSLDCAVDDNLVVKAYRAFEAAYRKAAGHAMPPHDVRLDKVIPDGAGLGGGSADATFTLRMLNEIHGLPLCDADMARMALSLGADCPFFLLDRPAYAEGVGERLEEVEPRLSGKWLLLVKPDVYVSTREAFAGITPCEPKVPLRELYRLPINEWRGNIVNAFEAGIAARHPLVGEVKARLYGCGALYASMSGSGSSVYGIFEDEEKCRLAMHDFIGRDGIASASAILL